MPTAWLQPMPTSPTPYPLVVNLGLAKTGTTSLREFFRCSNWSRIVHDWGCGPNRDKQCADLIIDFLQSNAWRGAQRNRSRLDAYGHSATSADTLERRFRSIMGPFDAFTEVNQARQCVFPQVTYMRLLLKALPNACFVLTTRDTKEWITSLRHYRTRTSGAALLDELLATCPLDEPTVPALERWFEAHYARARHELSARVGCSVVVDIAHPLAGHELAARLPGTRAACWGHHNQRPGRTATNGKGVERRNMAVANSVWRPRQAIYLGTSSPTLDSLDVARCTRCVGAVCCPPVLMTIGNGHSGTTSVAKALLALPYFVTGKHGRKESKFFDLPSSRDRDPASVEDYVKQYTGTGPNASVYGVDLSPGLGACEPDIGAETLRRWLPRTKFLVFLREPVSYLYSHSYCRKASAFDWYVRSSRSSLPLAELCPVLKVWAWFERFAPERFLFLSTERLAREPLAHVLDVHDFLGLPPPNATHVQALERSLRHRSHDVATSINRSEPWNSTVALVQQTACPCQCALHELLRLDQPLYPFGACDCAALNPSARLTRNSTRQMAGMNAGCGQVSRRCP